MAILKFEWFYQQVETSRKMQNQWTPKIHLNIFFYFDFSHFQRFNLFEWLFFNFVQYLWKINFCPTINLWQKTFFFFIFFLRDIRFSGICTIDFFNHALSIGGLHNRRIIPHGWVLRVRSWIEFVAVFFLSSFFSLFS